MKRDDRGMVTVETAFASLFLAAALALVVAVLGALFTLGQCQVAANEIARQAARGDTAAVARAKADVPDGAAVSLRRTGGAVSVQVSFVAGVGPARWPLEASAQVIEEQPS